jgi:hypothetical protein
MLTVLTIVAVAAALGFGVYAWRLRGEERERSAARVAALAAAIEGTSSGVEASRSGFFETERQSAVQGHPLLKVAIGFGMAVLIIIAVAMSGDRVEPVTTGPAAGQSDSGALELLSMRHARTGDTLTVTGLVRNPGEAAPGTIMAVVFAFDREGGFVSSGRAPLEFATIAAGDESPFRVTIPDVKDVGRYRVSFRTDAGVVRHVDRRPTLQVSAN